EASAASRAPPTPADCFVAQLEAAKRLQREHFDKGPAAKHGRLDKTADLAKELRPQVDAVSREMLPALARIRADLQRDPELLRRHDARILRDFSEAVRNAALRFGAPR